MGRGRGPPEAHLDSTRNPQLRALATQILEELHATVTDFRRLQDRYGLGDGTAAAGLDAKARGGGTPATRASGADEARTNGAKSSMGVANERSWRKEFSLRTKWVIAGESWPQYQTTSQAR